VLPAKRPDRPLGYLEQPRPHVVRRITARRQGMTSAPARHLVSDSARADSTIDRQDDPGHVLGKITREV
jgi:hypothetical protein